MIRKMRWLLVAIVCCVGSILPGHGFRVLDECQPIQSGCSCQQDCPTWFEPWRCSKNETICRCSNVTLGGAVHCSDNSNSSLLRSGYCMTSSYENQLRTLYVGECPFSKLHGSEFKVYTPLPPEPSRLNTHMCGSLNRTGLLCSECEDGLGAAVFSPVLQCVKCFNSLYAWVLYTFIILFPPTVFFLVIVLFQIRANSAALNYFVFVSQYISVTVASAPFNYHISNPVNSILFTLYGFWNLDFFRYVIPPFCASDKLTTMHVLSLNYIIAFYPLLLIVVTYVCIELHDRNCRLLVCLWKPFHTCFTRSRRRWDPKASITHAFATFLLLSYSKLLFVSSSLLRFTRVYNTTARREGPLVLYYDASVIYLSYRHLPFFLLAIFVLAIFVAPPTLLLLLYPTKCFQKCLSRCRLSWHPLHAFADAFQGCYKNGTNQTCDCRYFAGLYLVFRIIFIFKIICQSNGDYGISVSIETMLSAIASLSFSLIRPYKKNFFNIVDSLHFALLSLNGQLTLYRVYDIVKVPQVLLYIYAIPLLYFIVYLVCRVMVCTGLTQRCHRQFKPFWQRATNHHLLPDRLTNTHPYTRLLNSAVKKKDVSLDFPACTYGSIQ